MARCFEFRTVIACVVLMAGLWILGEQREQWINAELDQMSASIEAVSITQRSMSRMLKELSQTQENHAEALYASLDYQGQINSALVELAGKEFLTQDDLQSLLAVVELEARGEGFVGKQMVAEVVLNRVKDDRFPDTVKAVVEQRGQFSVVRRGYVNTNITDETRQAVQAALYEDDITKGALYFRTKAGRRRWSGKREYLYTYGNHAYFK